MGIHPRNKDIAEHVERNAIERAERRLEMAREFWTVTELLFDNGSLDDVLPHDFIYSSEVDAKKAIQSAHEEDWERLQEEEDERSPVPELFWERSGEAWCPDTDVRYMLTRVEVK